MAALGAPLRWGKVREFPFPSLGKGNKQIPGQQGGIWGKEELGTRTKGEKQGEENYLNSNKTCFIRGSRSIFDPGSREKQYPGLCQPISRGERVIKAQDEWLAAQLSAPVKRKIVLNSLFAPKRVPPPHPRASALPSGEAPPCSSFFFSPGLSKIPEGKFE